MRIRSAAFFLLFCATNAFAFTAGNVVVVRIVNSAGAAPVFLDEYKPDGTFVQSVALPTAANGANRPLTLEGGRVTTGLMTRTMYKEYLVLAGYAATPGTVVMANSPS